MKKWILIGAGAIIAIVIIAVVMLASNLGPMIKTAVNNYGPGITKTDVRLGDVSISIFSAEASLKDFILGNPKGFNTSHAMKVGSINVNIDEKSITGDTIVIDRIEVLGPDISYEKSKGTDNFKTIIDNVKKSVGTEQKAEKKTSGGDEKKSGKKILIKNFIVKDGKVNLTTSLFAGKTFSAPLPDIHLKDIGQKKGGASPAEAFDEIFKALYAKITSPAVTDSLNQSLKALGSSFDALGKQVIEKGLGSSQENIKALSKDAEKSVEDLTNKVKGLFGK